MTPVVLQELNAVKLGKRDTAVTIGFDEIRLEEETAGKIITLVFKEKLDKDDYAKFVPQLEGLMCTGEKIRLLIELKDFKGWTFGATWEETKFTFRHMGEIEKLAIVGDQQWAKHMVAIVKSFTAATAKFFNAEQMEAAKKWLKEP